MNIEEKLYADIPALKPKIIEVNDIKKVLPEKSVLIEFSKYSPRDLRVLNNDNEDFTKEEKYAVFILKPNGEINFIDLGSARLLENKIEEALYSTKEYFDDADSLIYTLPSTTINK